MSYPDRIYTLTDPLTGVTRLLGESGLRLRESYKARGFEVAGPYVLAPVTEYRVTAARTFGTKGIKGREDISGAGSPFSSEDPTWRNFRQGSLQGAAGLAQAILLEAVHEEGREDVRIERRNVSPWEHEG